jgi:hypothetical protein
MKNWKGSGIVSNQYTYTGTVKVVMDMQTFDSGFTKREFVVTGTEDRYPQDVKFSLTKDRCALADKLVVGEEVTVHFNLRGNEYNGRYFNDLNAWRIERHEAGVPQSEDLGEDVDALPMDDGDAPF